jgi:protein-S-isoprenylcysteine O-methyltransferase Ste14
VSLVARAVAAVLVLPGTMGFVLPLVVIEPAWPKRPGWWGLAVVVAGVALLWWGAREFYVAGRGTLAPWWPPNRLVATGPFGYSRNPIYVAMLLIIAGWAIVYASRALAIYWMVMLVLFHVRTILGEEPALARAFGPEWDVYRRRVPRWISLRQVTGHRVP